jgi:hypothetical protein
MKEIFQMQSSKKRCLSLEERLIGDKESYFQDLIKSYQKELHKEKMLEIKGKLQEDGADTDKLLKKLYDLVKGGH